MRLFYQFIVMTLSAVTLSGCVETMYPNDVGSTQAYYTNVPATGYRHHHHRFYDDYRSTQTPPAPMANSFQSTQTPPAPSSTTVIETTQNSSYHATQTPMAPSDNSTQVTQTPVAPSGSPVASSIQTPAAPPA